MKKNSAKIFKKYSKKAKKRVIDEFIKHCFKLFYEAEVEFEVALVIVPSLTFWFVKEYELY